ncbi:MAG: SpoIIIAH-like family protein [Oscillospiraceae bacterium]|nr:SpoIIIAH-like family protein [Oscillospiraceae bacterium]
MRIWKRNMVVVTIVLFVCVAVYLNWSYGRSQEMGEMVSAKETMIASATASAQTSPSASAPAEPQATGKESTDQKGKKVLGQPVLVDSNESGDAAKTSGSTTSASGTGYFSNARLSRQQARDSALELLQKTVEDKSADQKAKDMATASIKAMANYTLTESQIENLVMAKGYADCVSYIGDSGISVVVSNGGKGLTDTDAAKISDIVQSETNFKPNQIKIIEAN